MSAPEAASSGALKAKLRVAVGDINTIYAGQPDFREHVSHAATMEDGLRGFLRDHMQASDAVVGQVRESVDAASRVEGILTTLLQGTGNGEVHAILKGAGELTAHARLLEDHVRAGRSAGDLACSAIRLALIEIHKMGTEYNAAAEQADALAANRTALAETVGVYGNNL